MGVWGREGDIQKPVCPCKSMGGWWSGPVVFPVERKESEKVLGSMKGGQVGRWLLAVLPHCTLHASPPGGLRQPPHTASHESFPDSFFHPMSPPGPVRLGSG